MDFRMHFERGWQTVWNFVGPVLLLTVVQLAVSICSLGLLAPVTTAGYMHSLLLAMRHGRTPEVRDLFSHMSLFLPLFLFGLGATVLVTIGLLFLLLPGLAVALGLAFVCLYMVPLMTDRKMDIFEALKESYAMAKRDPISDQVIITIIVMAILSIGGSIPLGILAAQPFAAAITLSVYEQRLLDTHGGRSTGDRQTSPPAGPPPPPPPPPGN